MQSKWLPVLSLVWASAVSAQEEPADFQSMTAAELQDRVAAMQTEGFRNACATKVPLFTELARRNPSHPGIKALGLDAAAFCAFEEGRDAEGLRLLKQGERGLSSETFDRLGLYFANRLKDAPEALARLRSLAATGQLGDIPPESIFAALDLIRRDGLREELNEFAYQLTATGGFAYLDFDVQGSLASGALRHAAKIGDHSRVEELLAYDPNPVGFLILLYDNGYAPIWPQVEAYAGDNLANVSDAYVKVTAERLTEKPEDRDRLSSYAHALLFAGRFQEVVDVARNWRQERGNLDGLEEGDAWSLNVEAFALDALGRVSEADQVFDQLATLPADEFPWVVNFVINRGSRLVGQERWEEGLAASDLAWSVADEHGSTYAKLLVARDRTCALEHLGRGREARRDIEFLLAHFDDYAPIATTGLLCVGRKAEAERLLAGALSKQLPRGAVLNEMQDARFELFYTPSALPKARDIVLASPELSEEVMKDVRVIPDRFVPIAYLRRMQLAQRTP